MNKNFYEILTILNNTNELTIGPLDIKFKNISKEIIFLILNNILKIEDKKRPLNKDIVNLDKVNKIKKLFDYFRENKIYYLHIMGKEMNDLYNFLDENDFIFKEIKPIKRKDEIKMFVSNKFNIRRFRDDFKVIISSYDFYARFPQNIFISYKYPNLARIFNSFRGTRHIRYAVTNTISEFFSEFEDSDNEILFLESLLLVNRNNRDVYIKNANTKLIKTYVNHFTPGARGPIIGYGFRGYNINYLLDNYNIDVIKDISFEKAIKLYVKGE